MEHSDKGAERLNFLVFVVAAVVVPLAFWLVGVTEACEEVGGVLMREWGWEGCVVEDN